VQATTLCDRTRDFMMMARMSCQAKSAITPKASFLPSRNFLLQGKRASGGKSATSGEWGECHKKELHRSPRPVDAGSPVVEEVLHSMEPRFGHDFGKLRVHSDAKTTDSVVSATGQFGPGTTPQAPPAEPEPVPMDNPPAKGPTIAITNGWADPAGKKKDRTTVGIGELNSFVVDDIEGGSWTSADGKGTTINSVTFRWTANATGTNTITYTTADGSISSVTMTTVVPSTLSGKNDGDLAYPKDTQGAGMNMTITVLPKTVSFQALELMEDTCDASAISGYFTSHAPASHDATAGASVWRQVGTANDVSDTADSSGYPSPWSKGSYTWSIPVSWRLKGATTSTPFSANNDQVVKITGTNGTTIVTKLGAKTAPRTP
jgi:hypothetical protein